jgi:hypothetical protein
MAAGAGAAGAATAGTGAAGAAGVATAGTAGAGAVAAGAGGAAAAGTAAAAGAGAATAAGAGAVATGAAKGGVVRTALTYGLKGAWWLTKQVLFKPTGLLLRGALMALPYALAAVGAILSSPVTVPLLIGSAVVGAVGYGIYAYANRLKIGNTLKMRMAQYGFSGRNDEHIKAVAEFEGLLVKQVTYAEDTAVLDKTDSTDEEFMTKVTKLFGLDVNNQKHMAKFSKWYKVRFKPVYLAHLTAMRKLKVTTPLRDVEDLVPSIKIAYVQATRALSVNYDEIQSPFTNHEFLEATATDVSSFAEAAIAEAKKKEPSAVIPAATAKTIGKEWEKSGLKISPLAFIIKAAAEALKAFPTFNSSLDGDNLVLKQYYHIGFAADTPNGLVVPVIKDADKKGLKQIAKELTDLSALARDGKLKPTDMQGATFTISSLGGIGGTGFTPIVNAPEVAILGVCKSQIKPVWNGKEFTPRLMCPLSLSFDHRVIDGAAAARFTVYLGKLLSDVRRLIL